MMLQRISLERDPAITSGPQPPARGRAKTNDIQPCSTRAFNAWPGVRGGWSTAKQGWQWCIAPRALRALLSSAAKGIGLRHVHLVCDVDNRASRRVAQKCGFTLYGQNGDDYQFELVLDPTPS